MKIEKFLNEVKRQHIRDGDLVKVGFGRCLFLKRFYSGAEDGVMFGYREGLNGDMEKYAIQEISQITKLGK